jgi:flagellar capping protein FliD
MSKQVEQLEKEKRELQDRLKNQEKKVKTEFSAN